jgi:alkanesulfonate monooxygenase
MDTDELLHFGWFIPTSGDTRVFGDRSEAEPPSMQLFSEVARAAEAAGFEFALVPIEVGCWEAWVTCSMIAAQTERLTPLVAARPGYIVPTLMAKMVTTFDQLTGGRISLNLIAGPGGAQQAMDGLRYDHDERYALMDESVEIMKRLWAASEPVTYEGRHYQIEGAVLRPPPFQRPHPPLYIGGESDAARDIGAKHANVYLFWGDTVEATAAKIADIRGRAEALGRGGELRFGMRLQVIVRDTEEEAWLAADEMIAGVTDQARERRRTMWSESESNDRMWELTQDSSDYRIAPHLWSGISTFRPGAGVAVVGDPEQVAATLQEFIDIGCTEFCLSGYPHAESAEAFGRLVMPYFADRIAAPDLTTAGS